MKTSYTCMTLLIIIVGLIFLLLGEKIPEQAWVGINWSNFFSDLGLYISVIVALQWYYDRQTKNELIKEVISTTVANSNVVISGIENYTRNTKQINYNDLLSHPDEVIVGFLHSTRFVDDQIFALKQRAMAGMETTILLSDPNGDAIKYLLTLNPVKEHVIPNINKTINRITEMNNQEGIKRKIRIKYHDTVLRYSFVHSRNGIWVKLYRNSIGVSETPGIYIRGGTPLYDYFNQDIQSLKEKAENV